MRELGPTFATCSDVSTYTVFLSWHAAKAYRAVLTHIIASEDCYLGERCFPWKYNDVVLCRAL